jgi:hypothetical protein
MKKKKEIKSLETQMLIQKKGTKKRININDE